MAGAQAGDYRVAAGAALSAHKFELADQFLQRGLEQFPHDAELMHMTARQDIARGNYDEGEQELRSALVAVREQGAAVVRSKGSVMATPAANDAAAEARFQFMMARATRAGSTQAAPPCKPEIFSRLGD